MGKETIKEPIILIKSNVVQKADHEPETWLTIFVHGIMNIQPHLNLTNLVHFINDEIEDTIYARSIEYLRKDNFFYQYHAMDRLGLHKIDTSKIKPGAAASCMASVYDYVSSVNCSKKINNVYYTFGWSGLMSTGIRQLEADILYSELVEELKKYHAQKIYPKIRIIGYSHGGNLAINLGLSHQKKLLESAHVDELLLIGVPLFSENYKGICSSLFKKIYHFYSYGDRVQPVDVFSKGSFFSSRTFDPNLTFKPPKNLVQIEYRIKRIAYLKPHKKMERYHKRLIRNASPGHTELWSFGWVHNYRQHLPIYPMPAVSFLSFMIQEIKKEHLEAPYLIAELRPYKEEMSITNYKTGKTTLKPFLTCQQMSLLRDYTLQFKPTNFDKKLFNSKIEAALERAAKEKELEWKLKPKEINRIIKTTGKKVKKSIRCIA